MTSEKDFLRKQRAMLDTSAKQLKTMRAMIGDVTSNTEEFAEVQKSVVDSVFMMAAIALQGLVEPQLAGFFNAVAADPSYKFDTIASLLTGMDYDPEGGEAGFKTLIPMPLPINTQFLTLKPRDILDMPNYKGLHMMARQLDVAIKLTGLADGERPPQEAMSPPYLLVDIMKTYAEGASWNPGFYPDLPAVKAEREKPFEIREYIQPRKIEKPPGNKFKSKP